MPLIHLLHLLMNKLYSLLLLAAVTFSGCATSRQFDSTAAKWLLPVNIAAAYFGSVALHEGGHAITANAFGASDIDVYVIPKKDSDGNQHLGLTTYYGEFSDIEHTTISALGPSAQFLGYVGAREVLKTTYVPRIIQPTIAWFGVFNQVGYYYHVVNGLFRNKKTDLGKEEAWISWIMLGGGLLYEFYDFFLVDKPEKKFQVLFGEYFYEPKPKNDYAFKILSGPARGGGFFAIEVRF
jgi:hypothetical protein